jgi:hypothetical protein
MSEMDATDPKVAGLWEKPDGTPVQDEPDDGAIPEEAAIQDGAELGDLEGGEEDATSE